MNWIRKHWGTDYFAKAKNDILQLVRFVFLFLNGVSYSAPKMRDYRKRSDAGESEEQLQVHRAKTTNDVPAYLNIAAAYGLEDDMEIGYSGGVVQSVEQEYMAYTTAAASELSVDILRFWEVNSDVIIIFDLY